MALTIAIDGHVGAGKSSVASGVAEALGILHLDTGAMYRAFGLKAVREGVDPHDEEKAAQLCARTEIAVRMGAGGQQTFLDGEDVTGLIRDEQVSAAASAISTVPAVRRCMVALQQGYAREMDIVMEGRDIGTTVMPDATFKFFLTGDAEARARRREMDNHRRGDFRPFAAVLDDLLKRDKQDMEREFDPLRQADDAILVDTTPMNQEQVIAHILSIIREGRT